jgi:uncharacterized membrane protein HdeD (DUF308 family)
MKSFFKFLASTNGRIVRIVAGIILIAIGLFANMNTVVGYILIVIGLIPLLAGIFDVCVFAPLFGRPFSGKKLRAE